MYLESVLYVDLTENRSWVRKFDAGFLSTYLGGVGLGARLLYDHLPAGVDARDLAEFRPRSRDGGGDHRGPVVRGARP